MIIDVVPGPIIIGILALILFLVAGVLAIILLIIRAIARKAKKAKENNPHIEE